MSILKYIFCLFFAVQGAFAQTPPEHGAAQVISPEKDDSIPHTMLRIGDLPPLEKGGKPASFFALIQGINADEMRQLVQGHEGEVFPPEAFADFKSRTPQNEIILVAFSPGNAAMVKRTTGMLRTFYSKYERNSQQILNGTILTGTGLYNWWHFKLPNNHYLTPWQTAGVLAWTLGSGIASDFMKSSWSQVSHHVSKILVRKSRDLSAAEPIDTNKVDTTLGRFIGTTGILLFISTGYALIVNLPTDGSSWNATMVMLAELTAVHAGMVFLFRDTIYRAEGLARTDLTKQQRETLAEGNRVARSVYDGAFTANFTAKNSLIPNDALIADFHRLILMLLPTSLLPAGIAGATPSPDYYMYLASMGTITAVLLAAYLKEDQLTSFLNSNWWAKKYSDATGFMYTFTDYFFRHGLRRMRRILNRYHRQLQSRDLEAAADDVVADAIEVSKELAAEYQHALAEGHGAEFIQRLQARDLSENGLEVRVSNDGQPELRIGLHNPLETIPPMANSCAGAL